MKNNSLIENIIKITFFSLPISSSMLINMMTNFIAMLMVARVSKQQLAAGALALPSTITIITVVATLFYSLGILISHLKGQENCNKQIGQIVKNGLFLAIILTIPSSIILWNGDKLLLIFKQNIALINIARNYFHFAAFSVFPVLIGSVVSQFFSGIGKPKYNTFTSLISLPFIVFLSYGFILGNFGFPKLGLAGVSCASCIGQLMTYSLIILYMFLYGTIQKYNIFSEKINFAVCKKIFTLGYPIGIQFGAEISALTIATYMMGHFGVTALAASQIVQQYILLIVMIILGISQSISILISQEYAKNNIKLIHQYILAGMMIVFFMFIIIATLFWIFPAQLMNLYMNHNNLKDIALIHLTKQLFAIAAFTLLADSIRNLFSSCLRGLHDSKTPMKISIACLWTISLPLSYFVGIILHCGPIGLRIGFMLGFIVAAFRLWEVLRLRIKSYVLLNQPNALIRNV